MAFSSFSSFNSLVTIPNNAAVASVAKTLTQLSGPTSAGGSTTYAFSNLNIGAQQQLATSSTGQYVYISASQATLPVGGYEFVFYYSSDYGTTWIPNMVLGPSQNTAQSKGSFGSCCCSSDGSIVYIANSNYGGNYGILKSTNYGTSSFSVTTLGNIKNAIIQDICCSSDGTYVYINGYGSMNNFRSTNSGVSYTSLSRIGNNTFANMTCSSNGQYVYMSYGAATYSGVWVSSDYGVSFTQATTTPTVWVACNSLGDKVFSSTPANGVLISYNYGVTFASLASSPFTNVGILRCDSTATNIIVTPMNSSDSYLSLYPYLSKDGGATFSSTDINVTSPVNYTTYMKWTVQAAFSQNGSYLYLISRNYANNYNPTYFYVFRYS